MVFVFPLNCNKTPLRLRDTIINAKEEKEEKNNSV